MGFRLYDDDKIKLIILYLLNELDTPLDFQTISEIFVWDGSINYFVFTDCFNQLVENGSIDKRESESENTVQYQISSIGRISIEAVEDTLLKFIKERIMRSATRLLAFKRDGSNVVTKLEPYDSGYQLTCTLKNNKLNIFEMKLYLDNEEEAELLQMGFDKKAEEIYGGILAMLSDDPKFIR